MQKLICRLVLCLVFLLTSPAIWAQWKQFESKDCAFKIDFPDESKVLGNSQTMNSEIGQIKMQTFANEPHNNVQYSVIVTTYPIKELSSDNKELVPLIFRGSIDSAVVNVKGKLLAEKQIQFEGYPGREVKLVFNNGEYFIDSRIYLVKTKMYMLQVISHKSRQADVPLDRFMNSFALLH